MSKKLNVAEDYHRSFIGSRTYFCYGDKESYYQLTPQNRARKACEDCPIRFQCYADVLLMPEDFVRFNAYCLDRKIITRRSAWDDWR